MATERDQWLDALRGIGIFLVVVGHTLRGIATAGVGEAGLLAFLDPRLYAVHVQLLFFVSGMLVAGSIQRNGVRVFALSRFPVILLPLVIWTYVFLGMKVLAGSHQNNIVGMDALLALPIPGYAHLWFLWALFLMHLLMAALWMLRGRIVSGRMLSLVVFVTSLLVAFNLNIGPQTAHWVGETLRFLPFFFFGLLLNEFGCKRVLSTALSWASLICFTGLFLAVPLLAVNAGMLLLTSLLLCLSLFGAGQVIMTWQPLARGLVYLGIGSMAIYVLHTIFSAAFRGGLIAIGITGWLPHLFIGIAVGIIGPLIVRHVAHKYKVARILAL